CGTPAIAVFAVAPPYTKTTAPVLARRISSRRVVRCSVTSSWLDSSSAISPFSFLVAVACRSAEGSSREALDEAVEEHVVEQRQRDAGDQRRRHQRPPVEDVAPDQLRVDAGRERLARRDGDEA